MKLLLSSIVCAALFASTADAAGVGTFFTYYEEGGLGPSNWKYLTMDNNQCGGMQGATGFGQSPVTISSDVGSRCDTNMQAYDFTGGDCTWEDLYFSISNNGAKVEPAPGKQCSFGSMSIPHTDNRFNALQFHIHTYSEHQIVGEGDNGFFPAELHVVHQEETAESFAVFGTMIAVGNFEHPLFEWFLQGWEAAAQKIEDKCPADSEPSVLVQKKVACTATGQKVWFQGTNGSTTPDYPVADTPNIYQLPTTPDFGVFTYKGGLTTPACTEIVNWNLLDTPMFVSAAQLDRLNELILCYVEPSTNDDGSVVSCKHSTVADENGSTSRPPEPLLGRTVIHRCPNGPNVVIDDVGVLPQEMKEFTKPAHEAEPANTKSSDCDKALYDGCNDDKRYDPSVSPNLKANALTWYDFEGFWSGRVTAYDADGAKLAESFASDRFSNTLPYPRDDVMMFVNRTAVETRYYETIYFVYPPASTEFCALPVPDESTNVVGVGTCGVNGYSTYGQRFATASFEKDGSAVILGANGRFAGTSRGEAVPVDESTFYITVSSDEFHISETETFTNDAKTRSSGSGQYLIFSDVPPYDEAPVAESYKYTLDQMTEEDFIQALQDAYEARNVAADDRVAVISQGYCVEGASCPSENDFREVDPKYASSPYDEDHKVNAGFIVMFVILGVAVVVAGMFAFHVQQMNSQADRYRSQFAKRIAETVEFKGDHEDLSPEALQKEFEQVDKDKDGIITKDELRAFMGGKMIDRDMDAMFAAMDIDGSGTVEFAEFCAFLAEMGHAFDKANKAKNIN